MRTGTSLLMGVVLLFSACATQRPEQKSLAAAPAAGVKPVSAKVCLNCHESKPNHLRAYFDNVAFKSKSIQLKLDDTVEIVRFNDQSLKVSNGAKVEPAEYLRSLPKGKEVHLEYVERDGIKTATSFSIKQPLKIAQEQLIGTTELRKLIAKGPEKGKYTLVDSRPVPRLQADGFIPTAINVPYPAFDKNVDKLPRDKAKLLIFYCQGETCAMSPSSAKKAEKLGYTNIKVYHDGIPVWMKKNFTLLTPVFLKEGWIDKGLPNVLLDVRAAADAEKGFIRGAVAFPAKNASRLIKTLPAKDKKPPFVVYDSGDGKLAEAVAQKLLSAGYTSVRILKGGIAAWTEAKYPVETGALATAAVYVPKPKAGEIAIAEFQKLVDSRSADVILLDVRNPDEYTEARIEGSKNIPADQLVDRLAELPKDKRIIAYCSTGVRGEMGYFTLKDKGYPNVSFLNATIEFKKDGKLKIEKL